MFPLPAPRKLLPLSTIVWFAFLFASAKAQGPSFESKKIPHGWSVVKGECEYGILRPRNPRVPLEVKTVEPLDPPVEAVFQFKSGPGDAASFQVLAEDSSVAKPLLQVSLRASENESSMVTVSADGDALPLSNLYTSVWRASLSYGWRFPQVKNLWDDASRREIGAAYAMLTPFADRIFTLRMVLEKKGRSLWLDDRFLAEVPRVNAGRVFVSMQLTKDAQVLSAKFSKPRAHGSFMPLRLDNFGHRKSGPGSSEPKSSVLEDEGSVPLWIPQGGGSDVELRLSDSLYRYRRTAGTGLNTAYVDAAASWPGAFDIDPASITLRVPYRSYQNAWMLAWVDDTPNAVAKGTLRFYRQSAGNPASTAFEISDESERAGLVRKTHRKTKDGKDIYLIRVPIDASGLYGLRDAEGHYLDFELCKPTVLGRSYPDPIYYGEHPAGLPSSIRVIALTLEEAPFDFVVNPAKTAFVFEQPEQVQCTVPVRNTRPTAIDVRVTAKTLSYDHSEKQEVSVRVQIPPNGSKESLLTLPCKVLGWHDLKIEVQSADCVRTAPLSLVLLPPNKRTYGFETNETRFGAWELRGHYTPPVTVSADKRIALTEKLLELYRRLGIRRIAPFNGYSSEPKPDPAALREEGLRIMQKHGFLPVGSHTIAGNKFDSDPRLRQQALDREVAHVFDTTRFPGTTYFYGGEWGISREIQHGPWPRYTGDGDRPFTDVENGNLNRHISIFSDIGRAIRKVSPQTKLVLQWGAVNGTFAYIRNGFPRDLVDMFGMDAPHFELMPEVSNVTGSINEIWQFRQEIERLGWPQLPINWTEGPFFPTNPGALSEAEQAEYQIRYWLIAMAYGVDVFESGIVPFDAGNYYGSEHYGAGVFRRTPLECPKPAVAAIATATSMLCGANVSGTVPTDALTTYAMSFERQRDKARIYAIWRASGRSDGRLKIEGGSATMTNAMGIVRTVTATDGWIEVPISSSPIWITGAGKISEIKTGTSRYSESPAALSKPLAAMSSALWAYDGSENKSYANNHFAIRRITDPTLQVDFGQGEEGYQDALAVTLPVGPDDRPLANRYGSLRPKKPIPIPGKAAALGMHIRGNNSWGRIVYQLRDAKGEIWTSNGTRDDWNCDDTHGWSYIHFDGWRYVRFPLPSSHPFDAARGLETTWWGSSGGDGIVDLPLSVERIFVEARNEVPWLGQMKQIPDRTYKLSQLIVEYAAESDMGAEILTMNRLRAPVPAWAGPTANPLARLRIEGFEEGPEAPNFTEPDHFNDGRSMVVHFPHREDRTYNLYLSLLPDGRGAELHAKGVKDGANVRGFRPEVPMYMFLTAVAPDKRESKPSQPFKLITHDNFAEK